MKKNKIVLGITVSALLFLTGCDDMTSIYKEYRGDSPIHYTAKVKDALIRPGFNKAELSWPALNDPSIKKVLISWGNGTGSVTYDWDSSQPFKQVIQDLPEGSIIMSIVTMDQVGTTSLKTDVSTVIYGDVFKSGLEPSRITSGTNIVDYNVILLNLSHSSNPYYKGMEVLYTDSSGKEKSIWLEKGTNSCKIRDAGLMDFRCRSYFAFGDNALEEYESEIIPSGEIQPGTVEPYMLDKSKIKGIKLIGDTEIHAGFPQGVANIFDGKIPTTRIQNFGSPYHTIVYAPFPVLFSFDMGDNYYLSSLLWFPRHILCYGHPRFFEIYGAMELNPDSTRELYDSDGVLDPYWTLLASFESTRPSGATVSSIDVGLTEEEWQILFNGQRFEFPSGTPQARYIRVRVLQTWGGGDPLHSTYVECNELTLYGASL